MLATRLAKDMFQRKTGHSAAVVARTGLFVGLFLVTLAHPAIILAADPPDDPPLESGDDKSSEAAAEALAADARTLYESGQYAQAITAYVKAHRLAPAGALLYNIAFIYDQKLNENELALDFYRRFIRSPDADPALMERANQRIAELKAVAASPGTDGVPALAELGPTATSEPVVTGSAVVTNQPEPGGRPMRTAGWVLTGVGFAAAATGVVFGVLAQSTHEDFENAHSLNDKLDLSDTGETQALTGDVLMGVGAAALVAGVVLLIVDATSDTAERSADAGPSYRFGTTLIGTESLTPVFTFGGNL